MRRILNDLKIMILANLWIVPVMAALVWALFQFVAPPPPMSASMATGTQGGAYQHFAERLKEELAKEGFELTLVPTSGSRDNLQRLLAEAPEVQIALVQSGLERQLAPDEQRQLQSLGRSIRSRCGCSIAVTLSWIALPTCCRCASAWAAKAAAPAPPVMPFSAPMPSSRNNIPTPGRASAAVRPLGR